MILNACRDKWNLRRIDGREGVMAESSMKPNCRIVLRWSLSILSSRVFGGGPYHITVLKDGHNK